MGRTHTRRVPVDNRWEPAPGLPFTITSHAIEQFQARIAPNLTWKRCVQEAHVLARTAVRTEMRTGAGDEVWCATDGAPVRFVCRTDRGRRVCTTILPALERDAASGEE